MTEKLVLAYTDVRAQAERIAAQVAACPPSPVRVFGIPRGGVIPAYMICNALQQRGFDASVTFKAPEAHILIDDIYDSGATANRWADLYPGKPLWVLFDKRKELWAGKWLVMPWEDQGVGGPEDAVTRLIQFLGDDPTRPGLVETPARVVRAWAEWGAGYKQDPAEVLKVFEDGADGCDEMVVVRDIPLVSTCEHHLAPFMGVAHVGYIPNGKVVGLSKLARLVEVYGRRLQVQERLTCQIADALMEHVDPLGVGVMIRAEHTCMSTRGVRVHGSSTITSALRGAIKEKPEARAEFLGFCR